MHRSKCQKFNSLHKLEYYREIAWYCKANFKTNSFGLETKKEKPYTHSFRYINCKSDHQMDNINCQFWKHRFNRDWHNKKSQEL